MRFIFFVIITALLTSYSLPSAAGGGERIFEFTYQVLPSELPPGEAVDVYVPLPAEHAGQSVLDEYLNSTSDGQIGVDIRHGNRYYRITRAASSDEPLVAKLRWTVARNTVYAGMDTAISDAERAKFLSPDSLVPVGHEILQPILKEIRLARLNDSPAATARAIYDWVVDNVEYKKIGTGWGNGDTFWACNERYGNCTDFHALFVALARSEGIPARFEIGFPVPMGRPAGDISGYHCWVQFYLPDEGWIPIDASEAAKHPEKRELFYGTHPTDRIHFTTGRDLVLSDASEQQPLNYFVYPYVEVSGKPWKGKMKTRFSYREVTSENPQSIVSQTSD